MEKELISVENGWLRKERQPIFSGIYLRIRMNEIAGIIYDDIQTKRYLNEFLLGKLEIESGKIFVNEKRIATSSSGAVFQKITSLVGKKSKLIDSLTLEENIFLFTDPSFFISKARYKERFTELEKRLSITLPLSSKVSDLSQKERIIAEILRAYVEKKKLIILDDLSGFLQREELQEIFSELLKFLKFDMTFLLTVEFEDEYLKKINKITAVKNGKTAAVFDAETISIKTILRRVYFNESTLKLNTRKRQGISYAQDIPVIEFQNVFAPGLQNICFNVKKGELIKINCHDDESCIQMAGLLQGSIKPLSGHICLEGKVYQASGIDSAVHNGVCFINECAYDSMIFYNMSAVENLGIPCSEKVKHFWMFKKFQESILKQLKIRNENVLLNTQAKNLKSYTLMQIAYLKWLLFYPKVIVCINPFTDIDIYMREKAIDLIHRYLERGISVIILTSNYNLADRLDGRTINIINGKQYN